ncbi:MAG: polysaccharide biosynthesis tyrosine autokinase [Rhodobacteraceae bacterium]|nr:MAG: polysaccharide biosynthesis tyrosine autokinase [Paracoccaceae bacterium]
MKPDQRKYLLKDLQRVSPLRSATLDAATDLVDFGYIVSVLRRDRWLILGLTVAAVLVTFILVQRIAPAYTSSAQVLLETRQERGLSSEQVVSNLNATPAVIAGEVELIRSSMLIGRVVDALNLTEHPDYDPRIERDTGLLRSAVRSVRGLIGGGTAEPMSEDDIRAATIARLQRDITASQVGVSFAIRISAKASTPRLAADIANTVAEQYVEALLSVKRDATERATGWLQARIAELERQVEEADRAAVAFRAEMTEEFGGDTEATEQLLSDLNSRYIATRIEHSDAAFRYEMVQSLYERQGFDAVADIVSSPLLETLVQQRSELLRQRAEIAQSLGDRSRRLVGVTAQIEDLERSIEAELLRQIESLRSQMEIATNREASLLAAMQEIQERKANVSAANVTLEQLERSADALRETYSTTLARFMETAAQTDIQLPDAQIISQARPPSSPSEPRVPLLLALAAFFGLSAGVGTSFVREALNKTVRSADALRALTSLPIISAVPFVPEMRRERSWFIKEINDSAQSPFMEAVRSIRVKLFDLRGTCRPKTLSITSSVAAEGKTTTSLMLAHTLAKKWVAVLVIHADLRRSVGCSAIGADPEGGCLVDFLEGKTQLADAIQHLPDFGFDIMLPLRPVKNPGDLITSNKFSEILLPTVSKHYDLVIIDTAPVLAAPDALFLSSHADDTLMIVQSNRTAAKSVQEALRRLDEAGASLFGTVMTQVDPDDEMLKESYSYAGY